MRVFLAILFAVTQLAGPWLCCCGPAKAAHAFHITPPPVPVPEAVDDCCPHCKKELPPGPTEPPPVPHAPDRCPCGGMQVLAVPPAKPDHSPTADGLPETITSGPEVVVTVESVEVGSLTGLRELPHLTTADRLFGHHVLRC